MADYEETVTDDDLNSLSASLSSTGSEYDGNDEDEALPYQFEPLISPDRLAVRRMTAANQDPDPGNDRLHDLYWCTCRTCPVMDTNRECVCCRETEKVSDKVAEYNTEYGAHILCITEHPGFSSVCLDQYVLETAYYQYRQQYGVIRFDDMNERRRYVGYRQLVRWCWGYLGKEVRVILPACAVSAIRRQYPSQQYRGFQDA